MSRGSEHVDNLLDGVVGAVVGGFDLAVCGRWWGSARWWKRLLAIGPQSRLWKNRNSRATWTPLVVNPGPSRSQRPPHRTRRRKHASDPEVNKTRKLDQTSSPVTQSLRPARLATRAASFRYGGRHHSGILGAIIPLYPGDFVGIRTLTRRTIVAILQPRKE